MLLAALFLCLSLPSYAQEPDWYVRSMEMQGQGAASVVKGRNVAAKPSIFAGSLVDRARVHVGKTAADLGLPRTLWCADFMNMISGGGTGSRIASSWLHAGTRISGPQVGAVALISRGRRIGHVGIVSGIDSVGNPIIISGNHNRRVVEAVYPRGRVYAYVVPSS